MKTNYLFPYKFKKVGIALLIPLLILAIIYSFKQFEFDVLNIKVFAIYDDQIFGKSVFFNLSKNNILDEFLCIGLIVSASMVAFSREKQEDEFISKIRYESLLWATYLNYAVLLFSIMFFYGGSFFWIMSANMFTILLFFIIRFNWIIFSYNQSASDEK